MAGSILSKKKDVSVKASARAARIKSEQKLPKKLPAAVCAQFVRCGKVGCKCARGELHGPFHYCFWREEGKLKKAYIRKADVERVRDLCQANRLSRQMLNIDFDFWRSLQLELREVESHACANQA